jgi:chemotaxis protein MotA
MIEGLRERKYVQTSKKRPAPLSLMIAVGMFALVGIASFGVGAGRSLFDFRGMVIVVGGTAASMIFQYDLSTVFSSLRTVWLSFLGTPDRHLQKTMRRLDMAIIDGQSLTQLKDVNGITGEILGDVIYMYSQGLTFDEIDVFVTARVQDEFLQREIAMGMLQKATIVAPSFGLFGTVIGLVQVMQSMSSPGQIGPAMSLALMTTAYGAGLASLVFTPLAGRLEHHNQIFLECHKQFLAKVGILIKRDDESMEVLRDGVAA